MIDTEKLKSIECQILTNEHIFIEKRPCHICILF